MRGAAMNASCGMLTPPYSRIRFLTFFFFSNSLRLRVASVDRLVSVIVSPTVVCAVMKPISPALNLPCAYAYPHHLDVMIDPARSALMASIRKRDTKPELVVRRLCHQLGFRFRLYRRDLPGTPDLVFPRLRKLIWVHGCFWHQHSGCKLAKLPKSRLDYWLPKLRRNRERDVASEAAVSALGWRSLIIWECETKDIDSLTTALETFLQSSPQPNAAELEKSS
jgi:DNA mismatch endonuclease (patch repair protein)